MTTNYHTAISVGAAANAATFNAPLGQLDAAIGTSLGLNPDGSTVGATAQAQAFTKGLSTANTTTLTSGITTCEFTLTSTPASAANGAFFAVIGTSIYSGAACSGNVIGMKGHGKITANYSNVVAGLEGVAESSSDNTTSTDKSLYGVRTYAVNSGSGSIAHAMGLKVNTPINSGGGTIEHNWGIYIAKQDISSAHGAAALHIEGIGIDNAIGFSGEDSDAENSRIYSDAAGMLCVSASAIGINTTTRFASYGLDIASGNVALCLGADSGTTTRTNSTAKIGICGAPHYTNTEKPATIFQMASNQYNNFLYIGGGSTAGNAATYIAFMTAADNVTVTGTERMRVDETGKVGIGTNAPAARLHVDQAATDGAVPVLTLDQADVSEPFIKLIGESTTDNTQSLIDAADLEDAGAIVGWFKVYIEDVAASGAIADSVYFIPFYSTPTHSP
jgi:hypothetical protein